MHIALIHKNLTQILRKFLLNYLNSRRSRMSSPLDFGMSSPPETELRGRRHSELAPALLGVAATSKAFYSPTSSKRINRSR
jgi:hypothetical protein